MSGQTTLSTHVLDTTTGRPAAGVTLALTTADGAPIAAAVTDHDGRITDLAIVGPGRYAITFDTGAYFPDGLYPEVTIVFDAPGGHLHLPLLLSPFAYSTYRGS
ncbi:hydroxyisourate hydrolase [Tsukamurella soli]|uniref:5-hydroxyisourate hydrolase n=1 Tax=Tsukamurella soli TaxID=644556 RepID=A0ABP8JVY9_9ACTN